MDFSVRVDSKTGVAVLSVTGEITDQEMREMAVKLGSLPEIRPDRPLLVDSSQSDSRRLSIRVVREIATGLLSYRGVAKRAVVVPTAGTFGMTRMYEIMRDRDSGDFHVFLDLEEAWRWITRSEEIESEGADAE